MILKDDIHSAFFSFFGGKQKFDCWMSQTADILSNPNDPRVKPIKLSEQHFPLQLQELMKAPHEVLDTLIGNLEIIKAWEFTLRSDNGESQVIDEVTGHVVEVGNEIELSKKYGIVNGD